MKTVILQITAAAFALSAFGAEPSVKVTFVRFGSYLGPGPVRELLPGKATNIAVLLPQDGRTGRVGVLQKVGPRPRDFNWPRVECDQEIQCAHDGMPPRILPATETKR